MSGLDHAHALVVGIANYEQINSLPSTVLKDARDIRDMHRAIGIDFCIRH